MFDKGNDMIGFAKAGAWDVSEGRASVIDFRKRAVTHFGNNGVTGVDEVGMEDGGGVRDVDAVVFSVEPITTVGEEEEGIFEVIEMFGRGVLKRSTAHGDHDGSCIIGQAECLARFGA